MIRQFAVFDNPSPKNRSEAPYIVVLQSHFLNALDTVVVAPLMRLQGPTKPDGLLVEIELLGEPLVLNVALIANIQTRGLRSPKTDLSDYEDDIRRALDRLFTGF